MALAGLPEGEYTGAAAVAEGIGAPRNYLGKLLQTLSRKGLVTSQKGLGGGFRLARDPREISLLDVIEPIEDIHRWDGCIMGQDPCSDDDACPVHSSWKHVRAGYMRFLKQTTVADMVVHRRTSKGEG